MLWYGQNATEQTCVFGLNRPIERAHLFVRVSDRDRESGKCPARGISEGSGRTPARMIML